MRQFFIAASVIATCFAGLFAIHEVRVAWFGGSSLANIEGCFDMATYSTFPEQSRCLQSLIRELLEVYSGSALLAYTVASSSPVIVVEGCHYIGHIVGQELYAKTGDVERALGLCSSACRHACTHGIISSAALNEITDTYPREDLAHSDVETIVQIGKKYCKKSSLCHGIGHLLFSSERDYSSALAVCDVIAVNATVREACAEGVFMESVGLEYSLAGTPPSIVSHAGDSDYPCSAIDVQYRRACFRYIYPIQQSLFPYESKLTWLDYATGACMRASGVDRADCFWGAAHFLDEVFDKDTSAMRAYCAQRERTDAAACTQGVIKRFLDNEDYVGALYYCADEERASECFDAAFSRHKEGTLKKVDLARVCAESSAKDACINSLAKFVAL